MAIEHAVSARINQLLDDGHALKRGNEYGQVLSEEHAQRCNAWMVAALNVVQKIIDAPESAYRKAAERIAGKAWGYCAHDGVGEFTCVLSNLLRDAEMGLLASVANQARAEVFDDFLDHAKAYAKQGHADRAGVIAGVVFEDTLRRVCRNNGIEDKDTNLDALISELQKVGTLSPTKAKRARAAAHVRTKATHAQWDEFDMRDVSATIDFTEELIGELDG